MILRDETPADFAAIAALLEAAFPGPGEAGLVEALRAAGDLRLSLVAETDGAVLGYAGFSVMRAPFPALALAPVAVRPDRQGRGIGAALIIEGLRRAAAAGWRGVFVLGDPAYYQRFGFEIGQAAGFASPYAGAHFMALALGGEPLPVTTGAVVHAPAFVALD